MKLTSHQNFLNSEVRTDTILWSDAWVHMITAVVVMENGTGFRKILSNQKSIHDSSANIDGAASMFRAQQAVQEA